ncbi:hypothetical protein ACFY3N_33225 [Streptomyces sp. NPDC000348]|uniref:hypothetical protein n=1 Tax=Streptomyces sp. NPDC000348 TaxID=3364538 RepID=UPI003688FB16
MADLAAVSAVHYTRLEQGRARNPSDAVLDAPDRALRLDATGRVELARPRAPGPRSAERGRPGPRSRSQARRTGYPYGTGRGGSGRGGGRPGLRPESHGGRPGRQPPGPCHRGRPEPDARRAAQPRRACVPGRRRAGTVPAVG